MAEIVGQRTSANIASSQRVIDMAKPILLLEPSAAPLTTFLGRLGNRKRRALDPEFHWHEDQLRGRYLTVNGAVTASATSVVVDDADLAFENHILMNPRTGEQMYITARNTSTKTLTVVRGFGTTAGAAINDDDALLVVASAAPEGSDTPDPISNNPTKKTGYAEIFRDSAGISGTMLSSSNVSTPHDWPYQVKKSGIEHRKGIEQQFIVGEPAEKTVDGKIVWTTGGVLHYADENNKDMGGQMTEAEFLSWLTDLFIHGSDTKVLFCSPLVLQVINGFSIAKLQTTVAQTQYGVKVLQIVTAQGTVSLVRHKLLRDSYSGVAFAVDFGSDSVAYRPLNGDGPGPSRDTKLLVQRQSNGLDGRVDEWLTQAGLQFGEPLKHGVITGVTS